MAGQDISNNSDDNNNNDDDNGGDNNNDDGGGRQRDAWAGTGGEDRPTAQIPRPTVVPGSDARYGGVPQRGVPQHGVPQYGVPQYGAVNTGDGSSATFGAVPPAGQGAGPYPGTPSAPVPGGSAPGARKKWWTFPRLLVAAGIAVILAGGGGGAIGYAVGNAAGSHHQFSQRARLGAGGNGRRVPGSGQGGGQGGSRPTQGATNP